MRWLVLSVSTFCVMSLGATWASAQNGYLPYGTHVDRRHGNDHVYPDRGAVVRDVPRKGAVVNYAGLTFRFAGGVWYERLGPAYIVVDPPIGVIVQELPSFVTSFDSDGRTYLYANDVFYRSRPDRRGYVVVNDPEDEVAAQAPEEPADVSSASAPPLTTRAVAEPAAQASSDPLPSEPSVAAPSGDPAVPSNPTGIAIRARNGQSADQQAMDRYQCYRFAVTETGFDPMAANAGASPGDVTRGDLEYSRAQAACLEARGYFLP